MPERTAIKLEELAQRLANEFGTDTAYRIVHFPLDGDGFEYLSVKREEDNKKMLVLYYNGYVFGLDVPMSEIPQYLAEIEKKDAAINPLDKKLHEKILGRLRNYNPCIKADSGTVLVACSLHVAEKELDQITAELIKKYI